MNATKISVWRDETDGDDFWVVSADSEYSTRTLSTHSTYDAAIAAGHAQAAGRDLALVECDAGGEEMTIAVY